jgi:hypothetical protein
VGGSSVTGAVSALRYVGCFGAVEGKERALSTELGTVIDDMATRSRGVVTAEGRLATEEELATLQGELVAERLASKVSPSPSLALSPCFSSRTCVGE